MDVPDGYSDVRAGKIVSVVTSLQMNERPALRSAHRAQSWVLRRVTHPAPDWYRDLFHRIGDDWLWFSRLELDDDALRSSIQNPQVEVYAFQAGSREEGLLELDFRVDTDCKLAFLGLTPPLLGQGAGRWLMNQALERAWSRPIKRFWLHTCTLDHPAALSFYTRTGFVAFRRQVEVSDDPRLVGIIPRTAAPQVPLIESRPLLA